MNAIAKDAIPQPDWRVRRRRVQSSILLIRQHEWFEIDETVDCVWRGCEAGLTVEAMAQTAASDCNLPLGEALAATVYTLRRLEALGLVTLPDCLGDPVSNTP